MSLGTVLVIGGTSGIGLEVATQVVKSGSRVVVASSSQAKVDEAVKSLNKLSLNGSSATAFGYRIDLLDEALLEENILKLLKHASSAEITGDDTGKIRHIVHSAGDRLTFSLIQDWSLNEIFKSWTVRYLAAVVLAKHGPRYLSNSSASSITLTSGTMSVKPIAGGAAVAAQGNALEGLARGLAVELAPIRVNVVGPGTTWSPFLEKLNDDEVGRKRLAAFEQSNLLKKIATVEEAAQPYLYFMRDSHQTGAVLRSDGGKLLR